MAFSSQPSLYFDRKENVFYRFDERFKHFAKIRTQVQVGLEESEKIKSDSLKLFEKSKSSESIVLVTLIQFCIGSCFICNSIKNQHNTADKIKIPITIQSFQIIK